MTIKTAISLDEILFKKVETLAQELSISRSRLFALAVQEFIEKYENQHLLEAINAAYDDVPDVHEQVLQEQMRAQHREVVEGQW